MQSKWKTVTTNKNYEVSSYGYVRNARTKRSLSHFCEENGYYRVSLTKDRKSSKVSVHRLVAQAFLKNPNNHPQVNHKNGDKGDNRYKNLEWCSAKQNHDHARRTGLIRGSDLFIPVVAFNESETRIFRSVTDAARTIQCLKTNISKCCRGRRSKAGGYHWRYADREDRDAHRGLI